MSDMTVLASNNVHVMVIEIIVSGLLLNCDGDFPSLIYIYLAEVSNQCDDLIVGGHQELFLIQVKSSQNRNSFSNDDATNLFLFAKSTAKKK